MMHVPINIRCLGVQPCALYISVRQCAGWNSTPLVSGRSQEVGLLALGLGRLLMVVASGSVH